MSNLLFKGYVVNESTFVLNATIAQNKQQYVINPKLEFNINMNNDILKVLVNVKISNSLEAPTPFDISLKSLAEFKIKNMADLDTLRIEACEIFYPFLRSMIANITVNANMNPYFLPYIDFKKPVEAKKDIMIDYIVIRPIDDNI